ncbi:MAG: phosphoglycerate kinase [Spirochaetes bacterium]|nr:phosphoglycerate kinase [Spirochaetota bacterium]
MSNKLGIKPIDYYDYQGKNVLLRVDINSPIDPATKKIVNENRINKSIPTIQYLLDAGAKVAIIAHQGDTLDYQNLIPLTEHAEKLSEKLNCRIDYIDDVCGPAACEKVKNLKVGEAVILGNLRYLTEEISTFEEVVPLKAEEMLSTYLVRNLAPLMNYYINDAFAAAHRNAPSMVAFQQLLPSAAGPLFFNEVTALSKVMETPDRPAVFVLGGAKISDAFGMMKQVLSTGKADKILACGVTGEVMLMAKGTDLGSVKTKWIKERGLEKFLQPSKEYLRDYPEKIILPEDFAYEAQGQRCEININQLPVDQMYMDIGEATISKYQAIIADAGTIFVNGPAGAFENPLFEKGTKDIWTAIASAKGYSVVGGGDSVSAAQKFCQTQDFGYICTAGGAMVRFLSGVKLPLIEAMKKAK